MQAGKLRHRVELHSATAAQDAYGESIDTFASFATVWASVEPLQGRELEHAQQISAETNHKVTIRYNSTVTEAHRVIFGSRTLEITAIINPQERNEYQDLFCKEIG